MNILLTILTVLKECIPFLQEIVNVIIKHT